MHSNCIPVNPVHNSSFITSYPATDDNCRENIYLTRGVGSAFFFIPLYKNKHRVKVGVREKKEGLTVPESVWGKLNCWVCWRFDGFAHWHIGNFCCVIRDADVIRGYWGQFWFWCLRRKMQKLFRPWKSHDSDIEQKKVLNVVWHFDMNECSELNGES